MLHNHDLTTQRWLSHSYLTHLAVCDLFHLIESLLGVIMMPFFSEQSAQDNSEIQQYT